MGRDAREIQVFAIGDAGEVKILFFQAILEAATVDRDTIESKYFCDLAAIVVVLRLNIILDEGAVALALANSESGVDPEGSGNRIDRGRVVAFRLGR